MQILLAAKFNPIRTDEPVGKGLTASIVRSPLRLLVSEDPGFIRKLAAWQTTERTHLVGSVSWSLAPNEAEYDTVEAGSHKVELAATLFAWDRGHRQVMMEGISQPALLARQQEDTSQLEETQFRYFGCAKRKVRWEGWFECNGKR